MDVDIVSRGTGRSISRSVQSAQVYFPPWTKQEKDHPRLGLIAVLLRCPDCKGQVELTLANLYSRHRMACPHCPGTLDLHEETNRCLIWVGYRSLFDADLKIDSDGVVVRLRSFRQRADN